MINIPDRLVELIGSVRSGISGEAVAKFIQWAASNPQEANGMADQYYALSHNAKCEFRTLVFFGRQDPADALRKALEVQSRQHEERTWLSKILADARKDGYRSTMPNGVHYLLIRNDNHYHTEFTFQNVKVTLSHGGTQIAKYLKLLACGNVSLTYSDRITLDEKRAYDVMSPETEMIVGAIEANRNPYVETLVSEQKEDKR